MMDGWNKGSGKLFFAPFADLVGSDGVSLLHNPEVEGV